MYIIQNEYLELIVSEIGAEICSLRNKIDDLQYIWQGDPKYWSDHSPLLFPAIGDWKDNKYVIDGKEYEMPRHGFGRLEKFEIHCKDTEMICTLHSNKEIQTIYPFDFSLTIVYSLDRNILHVEQFINNESEKEMPYSIGEHIGFCVPLFKGEVYEDYYLEFEKEETANRYPLLNGRTIGKPVPCLMQTKRIPLHSEMFVNGAWNFKGLSSQRVCLASEKNQHKIIVDFPGFSHFSIWSVPNASYICIEPCNGIAASEEEGYDPYQKKGIHVLKQGHSEIVTYSVTLLSPKVEAFLENEEKKSILSKRISVRKFRKKVVTKEKIMRILKYAMASPSAGNSREWEFIVITEDAAKEKISQMSPYAVPAKNASVLIIPCLRKEKEWTDKQGNSWWVQNMAICSYGVLLAAKEEDLDGVWLGFYPDEKRMKLLAEYLKCENVLIPFSVIALGYRDGEALEKDRYDSDIVHFFSVSENHCSS